MKRTFYVALITAQLFSIFVLSRTAFSSTLSMEKASQQIILNDINHYRASQGLSKLKLNSFASSIAAKHSRDMAQNKVPFGHSGFNQRSKELYAHFKTFKAAENVVYTYRGPAEVVKLWLKSSGHRHNIEGKYNQTGIGVAYNKYGNIYVTQIFI